MRLSRIVLATAVIALSVGGTAEAKTRHHHRHHHAFNCGVMQMALNGIHDAKYALARAWLDFRPTFLHEGVVVVQSRRGMDSSGKHRGGHVSKVVHVIDDCTALVHDDRGVYRRNVCNNLLAYVEPGVRRY